MSLSLSFRNNFFIRDTFSEKVALEEVTVFESLISNQEETDIKVVLHALDPLSPCASHVCIRPPSGDIDIIVIVMENIT